MRINIALATVVTAAALVGSPAAQAASSSANTAALQVALHALHHYSGSIDGLGGPSTKSAVKSFQRSRHLPADGIAGTRTRRALGKRGAPLLGHRVIQSGDRGWDVAALQFMLKRVGYSPGSVDGGYGAGTVGAVKRFQAARGIGADGVAGNATLKALRHRAASSSSGSGTTTTPVSQPTGSIRFLRPVGGPEGDGFGHPPGRNGARHDGIDFPVPQGTPIGAAGVGTVTFAGWNSGGYGNLIVIQHRDGYETWYAHQSAFAVGNGAHVAGGVKIGYVGATGHATGPHLHFEVRLNGVPINPEPLFLAQTSLKIRPLNKLDTSELECTGKKKSKAPPRKQNPRTAKLVECR
jgi:peptidoglycan hydrolase-like protein with peptidoglycan-binding domain